MKVFVKTLKGNHFQIQVNPLDTSKSLSGNSKVAATAAAMPTSKALAMPESPVQASITSSTTVTDASPPISTPKSMPAPRTLAEGSAFKSLLAPESLVKASTSSLKPVINASPCASRGTKIPTPKSPAKALPSSSTIVTNPSSSIAESTPKLPAPTMSSSVSESDIIDQAASNLVASNGLENTIQHILHMGGGIWDRDTVNSALRAASNNPERAVDYLYSGIPKQADSSHVQTIGARHPTSTSSVHQQPTRPASVPSSRPHTDIYPLAFLHLGSDAAPTVALDFLRNSEQFQVLRAMVRANPRVLQLMLQDFGKQNPNLMRLILEHQTGFQRLLNEPVEGEGSILGQYAAAMPQAIQVTPAEHAAIERLEAMGFERSTVLEAYFACNKNEEFTANYLLDHVHEFEN